MRHFLSLKDFTKKEILEMIDIASEIKNELKAGRETPFLKNQSLGMIFEKSSTRTRVSFEVGMYQLGGQALFLSSNDIQLGRGEPMKDTARVISRMVDMVMIRTYEQSKLEEFAKYSKVPVINGLTDDYHPVQLMADYLTMLEFGFGEKSKVAYIGDGNNMTHSWMMLASKLGFELRIATPKGYEVKEQMVLDAQKFAKESGARIIYTNDPHAAIKDADIVTTDVWASMGQESEQKQREKDFAGFTIDKKMMNLASKNAKLLHCLPVHRNEEVTEEVFEENADIIFAEAENRLHVQKGIMVWLDRYRK
ncbi:MAG: ornithine carbamoyltransferase [Campylobacterota bacterium]|nr:ornithine carbamoyltransferase [Campylobacterota bacterium]MDQ1340669.1 ornithine carbamoyltransferase [Campylobacterota bacterium]